MRQDDGSSGDRGVHHLRFLFGIWVTLVSLGPHLEVGTLSGKRHRVGVCFGHQIDAELYAAAVNGLVEEAHGSAADGSAG
jgi:hypothetical protein